MFPSVSFPAAPAPAGFSRATMPPVPPGKVCLAEYGAYDDALDAEVTVLARAVGALHGFPEVTLSFSTRGFVPAGSCARWDEARWSVTYWTRDGARHGRGFAESDEAGARALFARWTDPQAVSARRQEEARLEEEVYAPARARRAAEAAAAAAAERDRRNGLARARRLRRAAPAGAR